MVSQNCSEQKLVLNSILNDASIATFFKEKEKINVINSFCDNEEILIVNEKKVYFNKNENENSLVILEYEQTDKIIFMELNLFNKNVIYSIIFKKNDDKLILLNRWTTFIKSK
jgi:hypothetical protein